ncbi:MAG: hypothetical protein ABQ298_02465 [Puniceicoccaceae bacterium]
MKKNKKMPQYVHPWPRIKNNRISACVLSPRRMIVIQRLIYDPIMFFAKAGGALIVFDILTKIFYSRSLYLYLPNLNPYWVYGYIIFALTLAGIEVSTRFGMSRWLFGQSIKIKFREDEVEVWKGFNKQSFSREYALSFAWKGFESAYYPVYRKSRKFQIVVNDQHSITLAEVFDVRLIEHLVENCNYANALSRQDQEFDLDPRTLARTPN